MHPKQERHWIGNKWRRGVIFLWAGREGVSPRLYVLKTEIDLTSYQLVEINSPPIPLRSNMHLARRNVSVFLPENGNLFDVPFTCEATLLSFIRYFDKRENFESSIIHWNEMNRD